ncbi:MAG: hypothetical protein LUH15_19360 [Tannerellaceae bacterium]|nr:hypothetical protein [Tannerellaceae bacterium]
MNHHSDYTMLVLANPEAAYSGFDLDQFKQQIEGMSEREVIQFYDYSVSSADFKEDTPEFDYQDNSHAIEQSYLPMSAREVKSKDASEVNVKLIRSVCRFDVTCLDNLKNDYKLVSASVWNAMRTTAIWDRSFNEFTDYSQRFYGVHADEGQITGGLYAFENYVKSPEQDDNITTCLILGLENLSSGHIEYFRVNINAANMGQQLKRNNVYVTTVKNVIGTGASDELEAYEGSEFLLDIDINGWNLDDQGNIQYDGDNILAIPTKNVTLLPDGETRDYAIFTLGTGTLEIYEKSLDPGLTAELDGKTLIITATPSAEDRTGYVILRFGNLKATMNIQQTGARTDRLVLSVATLPSFSSVAHESNSGYITVSSSGPWTAKIYNGNYFSFDTGSVAITDETGDDGDGFTVYAIDTNTDPTPRYAFVLVALDSNIEMSRVLVLAQNGIGGLGVSPEGPLHFTAMGTTAGDNTQDFYEITVDASDGDGGGGSSTQLEWEARLIAGLENFTITNSASNKFTIQATENVTANDFYSVVRVSLKATPTVYKDITITQSCYTLEINPTTVNAIATAGGSTSPVTVTTSSVSGWSANVVSTINQAYFNDTEGLTSYSDVNGKTFTITYPKLSVPNATPTSTVTIVALGKDGNPTAVQKTLQVQQTSLPSKNVVWQCYNGQYGTIGWGSSNINTWANVLRAQVLNTSLFGPNGAVYMPSGFTISSNSTTPSANTDIYQTNFTLPGTSNARTINSWWLGSNNRVLIVNQDGSMSSAINNLGLGTYGYNGNTCALPASQERVFNSDPAILNNKLIKYLLEEGPFTKGETPLTPNDIHFVGRDGVNNCVDRYPSEFVPILLDPRNNSRCIFGIDPVRRLIICGDVDLYSSGGSASANYNGPYSVAHYKFLNNVIAWAANVAIYGDDFLDQFK